MNSNLYIDYSTIKYCKEYILYFDLFGEGCDGCLNWTGMYDGFISIKDGKKELGADVNKTPKYSMKPANATTNQFLDTTVVSLEKIYKTIDWPYKTPSLDVR